ncbi:hypothetical protein BPC006_II1234 [Burkholderia pseudomallei BPC006]|nr:hypothetical protein BPC006_II1234 [Burkholderia pseudomallei BPC006]
MATSVTHSGAAPSSGCGESGCEDFMECIKRKD